VIRAGGIIALIGNVIGLLIAFENLRIANLGQAFGIADAKWIADVLWVTIAIAGFNSMLAATVFFEPKKISAVFVFLLSLLGMALGSSTFGFVMWLSLMGSAFIFRGLVLEKRKQKAKEVPA